jgi:hypothetical protein
LPRLRVHPNRHWLLVLILFEAFALTSVATADPIEPAKVRTIPIRPQSAADHGEPPASPSDAAKVPSDRDAELASASRPLAAPNGDPNRHAVRTITIRPDRDAYPAYAPGTLPAPNSDPDRHFNDTIRDPSQFMPD